MSILHSHHKICEVSLITIHYHFIYYFFYVAPKEDIFSGHLLSPVFQSSYTLQLQISYVTSEGRQSFQSMTCGYFNYQYEYSATRCHPLNYLFLLTLRPCCHDQSRVKFLLQPHGHAATLPHSENFGIATSKQFFYLKSSL